MNQITILLEKIKNVDSDYRYMGLNDLNTLIKTESFQMSSDAESKVVPVVTESLGDSNGEVQNIAVKTVSILVPKLSNAKVNDVIMGLLDLLHNKSDRVRDIASLAIKNVFSELSNTSVTLEHVLKAYIPFILNMNASEVAYEVLNDSLDILHDILTRFGDKINSLPALEEFLIPLVSFPRPAIRKKSALCLAALLRQLKDFKHLLSVMLEKIQSTDKNKKSWIICYGSAAVLNGKRLEHSSRTLLKPLMSIAQAKDEDVELTETILQTLEQMIIGYPQAFEDKLLELTEFALDCLRFDPNYNEAMLDEDGDEEMGDDLDLGEDDEFNDEDFTDDEDLSWKVRFNSARLLQTLIKSYPQHVGVLLQPIESQLPKRFLEREENVRVEILTVYSNMLTAVETNLGKFVLKPLVSNGTKKRKISHEDAKFMDLDDGSLILLMKENLSDDFEKLRQSMQKFKHQQIFRILIQMVSIFKSAMDFHVSHFIDFLPSAQAPSNLKLDALEYLSACFAHLTFEEAILPNMKKINDFLMTLLIKDSYFRVVISSIQTSKDLILKQARENENLINQIFEYAKSPDCDHEIRKVALETLGEIQPLSQLDPEEIFPVFQERLESSESLRLTVLRSYRQILSVSFKGFPPFASSLLQLLFQFLRKDDRHWKLATLELISLIYSKNDHVNVCENQDLVTQCLQLFDTQDLPLICLSLQILTYCLPLPNDGLLKKCLQLVDNPLMADSPQSIECLQNFFARWVEINPKRVQEIISPLVDRLSIHGTELSVSSLKAKDAAFTSQAMSIRAKCVAIVSKHSPVVDDIFIKNLKKYVENNHSVSEPVACLYFQTVGELAPDLQETQQKQLFDDCQKLLSFDRVISEEIRFSCAFALGRILNANAKEFSPWFLNKISLGVGLGENYMFLHSLSFSLDGKNELSQEFLQQIWLALFQHESTEQQNDGVLAECLGKIALTDAKEYFRDLQKRLKSGKSSETVIALSVLKFIVSHGSSSSSSSSVSLLRSLVDDFMQLLPEINQDLQVLRAAFSALNSILHNQPKLLSSYFSSIVFEIIFKNISVREDLISIVQMGPFKHKVDRGLEIRKSAYECIYVMLNLPFLTRQSDLLSKLFEKIAFALSDPAEEIQTLAHLMIPKICLLQKENQWLLVAFETNQELAGNICQSLRQMIFAKMKETAVQSEVYKHQEMTKSCLKSLIIISQTLNILSRDKFCIINNNNDVIQFNQLLTEIMANNQTSIIAREIYEEK